MKQSQPIIFVIFGGTGDLAKNKIFPALLDLKIKKCLPTEYKIIGFSRKDLSDSDYRDFVSKSIQNQNNGYNTDDISNFLNNIHYVQGDINDVDTYVNLNSTLKKQDGNIGQCTNKIFYLAVPPNLYEPVFTNLDKANLIETCNKETEKNWTRVLVEKPFGSNSEEAQRLDKMLGNLFDETQIFRIDHYLAKEALQNIITFRFSNPIFIPVWNRDHVEKIEVSLYETNDASDRGHFYDNIGALFDVGQNHVLQMLSLITMEDPKSLKSEEIRAARQKLISKIVPAHKNIEEYAIRAQYLGYKDEPGVDRKSNTDTFFQLKLNINNKRWKGVPVFIQSGKALDKKLVRLKITFKSKESCVCPIDDTCSYGNEITIEVHPEEKISLKFWSKKPGLDFGLEQKELSFDYRENQSPISDAYEKVLFDAIKGDQTLFNSTSEVATQWGLISKISKSWSGLPLETYEKGSDPESLLKLD
jgi:glucose-6-phosphate 1-dehydrogenase